MDGNNLKFSRRSFILLSSLGLIGGATGMAFKIRSQVLEIDDRLVESQKLSKWESENLPGLYQAMTGEHDQQNIRDSLTFFGQFLAHLPLARRRELNLCFRAFNILPLFFIGSFRPFYSLNLQDQISFLDKLSKGPALLYPIFSSLKELCYLAYYRLPQNYEKISYLGPVIKLKKPIKKHQEFYQNLKAKL